MQTFTTNNKEYPIEFIDIHTIVVHAELRGGTTREVIIALKKHFGKEYSVIIETPKYRLLDYYTGKTILENRYFSTEKEAYKAKHEYLKECLRDKIIHNNLILVTSYK